MGDLAAPENGVIVTRFFVPQKNIRGASATVAGPELEHMRKVLRLAAGDRVVLFDDGGSEHEGVIRSLGSASGDIAITRSYRPQRESPLSITLAQGLGKGDKLDWVVEKATELGAAAVMPFLSARTVPRPDAAAAEKRAARWRRIALGAAKQSGRTKIPEILPLINFSDLVARAWRCELKILFYEGESARGLAEARAEAPRVQSLMIVVGPEGGFTREEIAAAVGAGFLPLRLGARILRTETAAVAVLSLAQFIWGDLG